MPIGALFHEGVTPLLRMENGENGVTSSCLIYTSRREAKKTSQSSKNGF